jgi:transcriptional regulator with XRE-family HTH domain
VRVMLRAMDSFYEAFGALVRRARGDRMSQADLARRVGMSRGSIANIEVGRQRIPLHMLIVLARELGVEAASLLPDDAAGDADVVPADRLQRLRPEERAAIEKVVRRAREEREVNDGQG